MQVGPARIITMDQRVPYRLDGFSRRIYLKAGFGAIAATQAGLLACGHSRHRAALAVPQISQEAAACSAAAFRDEYRPELLDQTVAGREPLADQIALTRLNQRGSEMPDRPTIIDTDGHLLERQSDVRKYLEPPWDRRDSGLWTSDQPWDTELFGTLGYGDAYRRGMSPKEQIDVWHEVMDREGIETAVLFPSGSGNVAKLIEPGFQLAVARACNDHFAKEYNAHSDRVKAVGVLPMRQPEEAAKELRRAVTELGLISFEILSMGLPFGLGDTFYDPIYAAAQELDVPLCIHGNRNAFYELGGNQFKTFAEVHTFVFPAGVMLHFTSVLWNAVPLRFPGLKLAFLEAGATWLPYFLDRLDEHWEIRGKYEAPHLTKKPSDVFRESPIFVHGEAEESMLGEVVNRLGDDHFIYASDFPHWDAEFPANINKLWNRTDLSTESKVKFLNGNARVLFGLRAAASVG